MKFRESIIAFQNRAEQDFQEHKSFSSIARYLIAIAVFMASTFIAGLRMVILLPFNLFKTNKKDESGKYVCWINQADIDQVLNNYEVVLLDFWAAWCGPCIMMESSLEKFAEQTEDIYVAKVNADTNPALMKRFQIKGLPQLLLFQHGKEVKRYAGAMTANEMVAFIKS